MMTMFIPMELAMMKFPSVVKSIPVTAPDTWKVFKVDCGWRKSRTLRHFLHMLARSAHRTRTNDVLFLRQLVSPPMLPPHAIQLCREAHTALSLEPAVFHSLSAVPHALMPPLPLPPTSIKPFGENRTHVALAPFSWKASMTWQSPRWIAVARSLNALVRLTGY